MVATMKRSDGTPTQGSSSTQTTFDVYLYLARYLSVPLAGLVLTLENLPFFHPLSGVALPISIGVYGPPMGQTAIIFVDDLNMPEIETYGAQPPLELLRQMIDNGGW